MKLRGIYLKNKTSNRKDGNQHRHIIPLAVKANETLRKNARISNAMPRETGAFLI